MAMLKRRQSNIARTEPKGTPGAGGALKSVICLSQDFSSIPIFFKKRLILQTFRQNAVVHFETYELFFPRRRRTDGFQFDFFGFDFFWPDLLCPGLFQSGFFWPGLF